MIHPFKEICPICYGTFKKDFVFTKWKYMILSMFFYLNYPIELSEKQSKHTHTKLKQFFNQMRKWCS